MSSSPRLRIGVLGAARIVNDGLLRPAADFPDVDVVAVAARDSQRAAKFASTHGIERVHSTYTALLDDPDIDAVYIPLPASLHARWTAAAMERGKHVLTEKPFTSNSAAAEEIVRRATASDVVVMEAYHSVYHPMQQQLRDIITSGEIGEVRTAEAHFCVPIPPGRDIRWNLALGGGSLLDVGYYAVRQLTTLFGAPLEIEAAAKVRNGVDRTIVANLGFAGGVAGKIRSSLWSTRVLSMRLRIEGTAGTVSVRSPYHPQNGGRILVRTRSGRRSVSAERRSSYSFQIAAFRDAVLHKTPVLTDAHAALAHMRTLDAIYLAAGLRPRP